jgi:putative membrane protein
MRNSKLVRIGSVLMCAVMVAYSLAACGTHSNDADTVSEQDIDNMMNTDVSEALAKEIGIGTSDTGKTDTKEETVYVFTDATGAKHTVLVNEKLKNASAYETINDVTTLSDIENLTGDEEYTAGNGNAITWNADGNDITYRGTTDKDMPVDVKVTYYLDDKEISPEDIAGKSGKVRIRFDYTNNEKRTITANGKTREAYVPFTVVTGIVLSNDNFSNIEVENGKVTETVGSSMVIGFAMPGMKESLDLTFNDKELDIDIPEYFEVTADATDFEIDMIMSMMTSNLMTDTDLDDLDIDDLKDSMSDLKDATGELLDGTNELQDGTQKLQNNMPDLDDGLTELNDGAESLLEGAIQIDEGAGSLGAGISTLSDSVEKKLVPSIAALAAGAEQVSTGVATVSSMLTDSGAAISKAKSDLYSQANGSDALKGAIKECTGGQYNSVTEDNCDTVISALTSARDTLVATVCAEKVCDDKEACIAVMKTQNPNLDDAAAKEAYDKMDETTKAAYVATYTKNYRASAKDTINALNSAIESLNKLKGATEALDQVGKAFSTTSVSDEQKGQASALATGAATVAAGLKQLQQSVGTFDTKDIDAAIDSGNDTICSGLYKLKDGAEKLSDGTKEMRNGSKELKEGTQELRDSGDELIDGVKKLNDGAIELKDGVIEYDEDGIQKLTGLVDNDAEDVIQTLKAVIQLGKDYTSFAGKDDSWDGSVVFIYKIEGVSSN